MIDVLKFIYLTICVVSGIGFIATIEVIFTKQFYIPLSCLTICILAFFAAVPYLCEEDRKSIGNDDFKEVE